MRGAGVGEAGGSIRLLDLPGPGPLSPGEVVLAVHAAGVGNWDDLMRAGLWPSQLAPPHALGVEAAGVVVETGPDVAESWRGRRVLTYVDPLRANGAWAERLIAPVTAVAELPSHLDWLVAAVLPVPLLTAAQTLEGLPVAGSRLFVHGAGGLTGGYLVELALARGAQVVATAGRRSADRLRALGAQVVDRTAPDVVAAVHAVLGGPPEHAVNAVPGGAGLALDVAGDPARLVSIAGAVPPGVRQVYVAPDGPLLARMVGLVGDGTLSTPTIEQHRLDDAATALARSVAGAAGAGVALSVSSGAANGSPAPSDPGAGRTA